MMILTNQSWREKYDNDNHYKWIFSPSPPLSFHDQMRVNGSTFIIYLFIHYLLNRLVYHLLLLSIKSCLLLQLLLSPKDKLVFENTKT